MRSMVLVMAMGLLSMPAARADVFDDAAKGRLASVWAYLDAGKDINAADAEGARALHHAVAGGQTAVVKLLIERKADVMAAKKDGVTPLHVAGALGRGEIYRLLVAAGADESARDTKGRTPSELREAYAQRHPIDHQGKPRAGATADSEALLAAGREATPWHVPLRGDGPLVGFVLPDISAYPSNKSLLIMPYLSAPVLFSQAGYRVALLVSPAMAGNARIQKALRLTEYETLAQPLTPQTDLKPFALLVAPVAPALMRDSLAPDYLPVLDGYVRAGGKLICWAHTFHTIPAVARFLHMDESQIGMVPFRVEKSADHPIVGTVEAPLQPLHARAVAVDVGNPGDGVTLLRYADGGPPFLRLFAEGQGAIAHFNCPSRLCHPGNGLTADGFLMQDLVLQAADWLTGFMPPTPRPAMAERLRALRETDSLKPADPDRLLYSCSFDRTADLAPWTLWDVPEPSLGSTRGKWWVDTTIGALTQTSNIFSNRGVGTRALLGEPEWADYVISATIASFDDDEFGIVFRFQDPENYYRFTLDADSILRIRLEKRRNGQWRWLANMERPYIPAIPVRYQVSVEGNAFVAYANGKELLRATDSDFSAGKVGIETSGVDCLAVYDFEVAKP